MREPLAHCGRMTKPELICHLIAAVLGEWTRIQTETRNGGARGGELDGALPARRASIVTME